MQVIDACDENIFVLVNKSSLVSMLQLFIRSQLWIIQNFLTRTIKRFVLEFGLTKELKQIVILPFIGCITHL